MPELSCCLPLACDGSRVSCGAPAASAATCAELVRGALLGLGCAPPPAPSDRGGPPQAAALAARPEAAERISWETFTFPFLVAPGMATAVGMAACPMLRWAYLQAQKRSPALHAFVLKHVGTLEHANPKHPTFLVWLSMAQATLSIVAVCMFVRASYTQNASIEGLLIERFLAAFFAFNWLVNAANKEFWWAYVLTPASLMDIFTVVPAFVERTSVGWVSLLYFRSYSCSRAIERLIGLGCTKRYIGSEDSITREICILLLRVFVLIIVFAGTILLLEVLGENPWLPNGRFIETEMGDISFFVVFYWIIETISTVGYGDFSPKTTLSRLTTMLLMFSGVLLFAVETERLMSLVEKGKTGHGSFLKGLNQHHVVLIGGGVRHADDELILAFLNDILNKSHTLTWPHVVMMSVGDHKEHFSELVSKSLDWQAHQRVHYFVGSPLDQADLQRVDVAGAKLVVILADTGGSVGAEDEDSENIMQALSVMNNYPSTPFYLMVLHADSKYQALAVGIPRATVFSAAELKSALFWHSCRCRGWNTMLCNLILTSECDISQGAREGPCGLEPDSYASGSGMEIYSFLPAACYIGKPYTSLVFEAYTMHHVIVFAVLINGEVVLLPSSEAETDGDDEVNACRQGGEEVTIMNDSVCFCIAPDASSLNPLTRAMRNGQTLQDWYKDESVRWTALKKSGDVEIPWEAAMSYGASNTSSFTRAVDLVYKEVGRTRTPRPSKTLSESLCEPLLGQNGESLAPQGSSAACVADCCVQSTSQKSHHQRCYSAPPVVLPGVVRWNDEATMVERKTHSRRPSARQVSEETDFSDNESITHLQSVNSDVAVSRRVHRRSSCCDHLEVLQISMARDLVDDADMGQLESRAQEIRGKAEDDPFVLVIDLSDSWQQLVPFIKEARRPYLHKHPAIVVLCDSRPPRSVLDDLGIMADSRIGVVYGDPCWVANLVRSGVHEAAILACMGAHAGSGRASEDQMLDLRTVMLFQVLSTLGIPDTHYTMFEFKRFQNLRLLPPVRWHERREPAHQGPEPSSPGSPARFRPRTVSGFVLAATLPAQATAPAQGPDWCFELLHSPRFASGQVFTPIVLGTMLARSYYMPGTVQAVKSLLLPGEHGQKPRAHQALLWQIKVPRKRSGKGFGTWGDLWRALFSGKYHQRVVALGLYRTPDKEGTGYVVTNPSDELELSARDLIFVLASQAWSTWAAEKGLLPMA